MYRNSINQNMLRKCLYSPLDLKKIEQKPFRNEPRSLRLGKKES